MKPILVILHGVSGSSGEMAPFVRALRGRFTLEVPNLLGHGGRPVPDGYTLEEMAADLVRWLDAEAIGPAHFLGYSLGGYLALYLARHHPGRVLSIAGVVVKHVFDAESVAHITYLADPERLARPGNPRKAELIQVHGEENWIRVTNNTAALVQGFGRRTPMSEEDLGAIGQPVLLLSGDADPLVPAAHSRRLAGLLPNARLGLFEGAAHPLKNVPMAKAARAIVDFIGEVEAGRFTPGAPLDLRMNLVAGGLPQPPIRTVIGKDRTR
ncbi:MAG TPA: alpha/beta hydrolase [Allosphingosinicella sp.]